MGRRTVEINEIRDRRMYKVLTWATNHGYRTQEVLLWMELRYYITQKHILRRLKSWNRGLEGNFDEVKIDLEDFLTDQMSAQKKQLQEIRKGKTKPILPSLF